MEKSYLKIFINILFSTSFIIGFGLISIVNADENSIMSNNYGSLQDCNIALEQNNKKYPSFDRSECFSEGGKYYYNICDQGTNCTGGSNGVSSGEQEVFDIILDDSDNPYKKFIPDNIFSRLVKIVDITREKKQNYEPKTYNELLDKLNIKLNKIKSKYHSNELIGHMVDYLKFEFKKLYVDESLDDFFCELTGDCNSIEGGTTQSSSTNVGGVQDYGNQAGTSTSTQNGGTTGGTNVGGVQDYGNQAGTSTSTQDGGTTGGADVGGVQDYGNQTGTSTQNGGTIGNITSTGEPFTKTKYGFNYGMIKNEVERGSFGYEILSQNVPNAGGVRYSSSFSGDCSNKEAVKEAINYNCNHENRGYSLYLKGYKYRTSVPDSSSFALGYNVLDGYGSGICEDGTVQYTCNQKLIYIYYKETYKPDNIDWSCNYSNNNKYYTCRATIDGAQNERENIKCPSNPPVSSKIGNYILSKLKLEKAPGSSSRGNKITDLVDGGKIDLSVSSCWKGKCECMYTQIAESDYSVSGVDTIDTEITSTNKYFKEIEDSSSDFLKYSIPKGAKVDLDTKVYNNGKTIGDCRYDFGNNNSIQFYYLNLTNNTTKKTITINEDKHIKVLCNVKGEPTEKLYREYKIEIEDEGEEKTIGFNGTVGGKTYNGVDSVPGTYKTIDSGSVSSSLVVNNSSTKVNFKWTKLGEFDSCQAQGLWPDVPFPGKIVSIDKTKDEGEFSLSFDKSGYIIFSCSYSDRLEPYSRKTIKKYIPVRVLSGTSSNTTSTDVGGIQDTQSVDIKPVCNFQNISVCEGNLEDKKYLFINKSGKYSCSTFSAYGAGTYYQIGKFECKSNGWFPIQTKTNFCTFEGISSCNAGFNETKTLYKKSDGSYSCSSGTKVGVYKCGINSSGPFRFVQ